MSEYIWLALMVPWYGCGMWLMHREGKNHDD